VLTEVVLVEEVAASETAAADSASSAVIPMAIPVKIGRFMMYYSFSVIAQLLIRKCRTVA
jgi:hypothetical protein